MGPPAPEPVIGKRKRGQAESSSASDTNIHVTIGTYERALHGFCASSASSEDGDSMSFTDLFLLNAHTSSIRCLALSPPSNHKRILATGSSDERIHLYQISTAAPSLQAKKRAKSDALLAAIPSLSAPSLTATASQRNRELGSLMHHTATISTLAFPSYSKLLTGALDNTLTILRTRDWTHLASMRAPAPKPRGRPDGDTAGPNDAPAGIADVAVHPSQRLAISVGLGERCMRLWNLVGGTKAGVLVFDRKLLERVGEPRKSMRAGEGRRIEWRPDGMEFAVAFEKGVALFSIDCQTRAVVALGVREKVGQIRYVPRSMEESEDAMPNVLAISTEAGDLLFYIADSDSVEAEADEVKALSLAGKIANPTSSGPRSRIKDFQILPHAGARDCCFVITGSSDGAVRIWNLDLSGMAKRAIPTSKAKAKANGTAKTDVADGQDVMTSKLLGVYETGKRVTCLSAFVMDPPDEGEAAIDAGADDDVAKVPGFSSDSEDDDDDDAEASEDSEDSPLEDDDDKDEEVAEEDEEFGGFEDE